MYVEVWFDVECEYVRVWVSKLWNEVKNWVVSVEDGDVEYKASYVV